MTGAPDQILSVEQMRGAEAALIAAGSSVAALMDVAGRGAADYVWRMAAGRRVTVLCGPGNNGGDGWVIAETLRQRHVPVVVVMAHEPATGAARAARAAYAGVVAGRDAAVVGEVLVDCLFGSGLRRALDAGDAWLLARLAACHVLRVAVDVPSGVDSDSGACLNAGLPDYHLTIALGAWKYAHFLMPAMANMGALRLVPIGCGAVPGAALVLGRPALTVPAADAHKYKRGLLAVVAGAMPGAAMLAAEAAQGAGAGYVKLLAPGVPDGLAVDVVLERVPEPGDLREALGDRRIGAVLVGPGLGRDGAALARLRAVLGVEGVPMVLDADALVVLRPEMVGSEMGHPEIVGGRLVATPHEGELAAMERAFGLGSGGGKVARAVALARASGMVIVAKGPDTVIASPGTGPDTEGGAQVVCAPRGSSWLSVAGTGDVLAGCIASRLACGVTPFVAACEGVWLHSAAARALARASGAAGAAGRGGPFSASALAGAVAGAYAAAM